MKAVLLVLVLLLSACAQHVMVDVEGCENHTVVRRLNVIVVVCDQPVEEAYE